MCVVLSYYNMFQFALKWIHGDKLIANTALKLDVFHLKPNPPPEVVEKSMSSEKHLTKHFQIADMNVLMPRTSPFNVEPLQANLVSENTVETREVEES